MSSAAGLDHVGQLDDNLQNQIFRHVRTQAAFKFETYPDEHMRIFTYALPSNWAEAYAGRRRLYMAQVCCAWRDIVFGIPRFWSIFRIFHSHNPPARESIRTCHPR